MTNREVLRHAAACDAAKRWEQWRSCGTHKLQMLPLTAEEQSPRRYCPQCWTLFAPSGAELNPALRPRDPT